VAKVASVDGFIKDYRWRGNGRKPHYTGRLGSLRTRSLGRLQRLRMRGLQRLRMRGLQRRSRSLRFRTVNTGRSPRLLRLTQAQQAPGDGRGRPQALFCKRLDIICASDAPTRPWAHGHPPWTRPDEVPKATGADPTGTVWTH